MTNRTESVAFAALYIGIAALAVSVVSLVICTI